MFLATMTATDSQESSLVQLDVQECPDVFSEELPGLPPPRELTGLVYPDSTRTKPYRVQVW